MQRYLALSSTGPLKTHAAFDAKSPIHRMPVRATSTPPSGGTRACPRPGCRRNECNGQICCDLPPSPASAIRLDGPGRGGDGAGNCCECPDMASCCELLTPLHDRAWGRPLAGRSALGRLPARLLSAGARSLAALPPSLPRKAPGRLSTPASCSSLEPRPIWRRAKRSRRFSRRCARPNGSSTRSDLSADPRRCWPNLARYTHRVAIANSRLMPLRGGAVTFKWKDYRLEGRDRQKTMTLPVSEFIRRFSFTSCPAASIAFATTTCWPAAPALQNIARARQLLATTVQARPNDALGSSRDADPPDPPRACPCCGGRMNIVETFEDAAARRPASPSRIRIDTS